MAVVSFAWTTPAFKARRKDTTRRDWKDSYAEQFEAGQIHEAADRQLRFGGKKIGRIQLTVTPFKQNTADMDDVEWYREASALLAE